MNQPTPTLPGIRNEGATMKPDELDGKTITVLSSQQVVRRDGSTGHKWLIRHEDGTLGLYWAPGMAPPQQVQQYFRQYPNAELRLLVQRHQNGDGFAKWTVQQLEENLPEPEAVAEDDVDQVPF